MVALPRIYYAEWEQHGFDSALDRRVLLLADDLLSAETLKRRLALLTDWNMKGHKRQALYTEDVQAVRLYYGDSRIFTKTELARPGINPVKFGAYLDKQEGTRRRTSALDC